MDASHVLSTVIAGMFSIWVQTALASPALMMVSPTPVTLHATPGLHNHHYRPS